LEEFQGLLARALDLESEDAASLAAMLAEAIWERLQWWKWREETETQRLERLFQETAATPPGSYEELHRRRHHLNSILELDDDFFHRMDEVTEKAAKALRWWVTQRPLIGLQPRWAGPPPAKPPANPPSDQPTTGSADPSAVA
jgi:hypothetical protein